MSILPGGRILAPLGEQHVTGAEPVALAVSASGKTLVTVNRGASRPSLTVMAQEKIWQVRQLPAAISGPFEQPAVAVRDDAWLSVSGGLAFSGERSIFIAEGNTGRIALLDLETGEPHRPIKVEEGAFTGDLALDSARNILYVADPGHSSVIVLDTRSRQILTSIELDGVPAALALGPDRGKLFVALARNLLHSRQTGGGLSVIDVTIPHAARVTDSIPVGGCLTHVIVTADRVYVSDCDDDCITVLSVRTGRVEMRIAIRIPGLENLRGVLPMGMAFDERNGWLLVAEAGINAIGVVDPRSGSLLGHLPVGWFPTRVSVSRGTAFVANGKGPGPRPNTRGSPAPWGSVSIFALPDAATLPASSRFVMEAAGFVTRPGSPPPLPAAVRHVVLVVKNGRSFDDVLGDIPRAANGTVMGAPQLARFGRDGYVNGQRRLLSLHHLNVTPNHHAIAARWTLSDNFYADADTGIEGFPWLSVLSHLARHGASFLRFGPGSESNLADTERARRLIAEIEANYTAPGVDLPGLILIHLPNDRMAPPDPRAGYSYPESYLADNDAALGRILEYFSNTPWWGRMAVFVTEASAEDGVDHIEAHRTLLLCAGPWARRNSVSHTNAAFPALRKTIFRLLGLPPLDLFDVSAADLGDCFTDTPDLHPYQVVAVDPRLYRP